MVRPVHNPRIPLDEQRRIHQWHERVYAAMRTRATLEIDCLGLRLTVPQDVFAPTEPFLLATAVAAEVQADDRVLDMGTGSGINAIVAAKRSQDVTAVDSNPQAVACAQANVERNGVRDRVNVLQSDLFESVTGLFDLIVFDPPFRWFRPRDLLETSISDEHYDALTRFVREAPNYLTERGRLLIHFGTSADLPYLNELIETGGLAKEVVLKSELESGDWPVSYFVFRVSRDSRTD